MDAKILQNHLEMLMLLGQQDHYATWESYKKYLEIKGALKK